MSEKQEESSFPKILKTTIIIEYDNGIKTSLIFDRRNELNKYEDFTLTMTPIAPLDGPINSFDQPIQEPKTKVTLEGEIYYKHIYMESGPNVESAESDNNLLPDSTNNLDKLGE